MFKPYSSAFLVEYLDALVVLFPVSTWVELAYACFCSRMENPYFSVYIRLRKPWIVLVVSIEAASMLLEGEAILMSAKGACSE